MPGRLESSIRRAVLDYAKKKYGALTKKMETGRFASSGWPDDMILVGPTKRSSDDAPWVPRMFFIEFKRPGNKLTPLQEAMMYEIEGRGFHYYTVFTVEGGKKVIDKELG
jgi:hypothetical protein